MNDKAPKELFDKHKSRETNTKMYIGIDYKMLSMNTYLWFKTKTSNTYLFQFRYLNSTCKIPHYANPHCARTYCSNNFSKIT